MPSSSLGKCYLITFQDLLTKSLLIEGTNWETSLNSLLLTCRTIYHETAPILYGNTVFYPDDAQRLGSFLKTVSNRNLACITSLHVHVRTYGIPNEAENNRWEQKHIKCWTKIFANIVVVRLMLFLYSCFTTDSRSGQETLGH